MRRTAAQAALTRATILDSALASFAQHGWRGATFDDIATRAGVTRGALNHHFASKHDLLAAALDERWSDVGGRLFVADGEEALPSARLEAMLTRYITWLHEDSRFRDLVSATVLAAPQSVDGAGSGADGKARGIDVWHREIVALLVDGRTSRDDAELTARLVVVVLQGLAVTAVTTPQHLPGGRHVRAAVRRLVAGLLP